MNVHFICRGNILRSLIAETYIKSLELKTVSAISSGTNVHWEDETERKYFLDSLKLLHNHGIEKYAKDLPEQLIQQRVNYQDITICMNQRVVDEAKDIVVLPSNTINWNIIDIGEGHRTIEADKELYLEEIYNEIVQKVDGLIITYKLHR